jgi:hypothetical protein
MGLLATVMGFNMNLSSSVKSLGNSAIIAESWVTV